MLAINGEQVVQNQTPEYLNGIALEGLSTLVDRVASVQDMVAGAAKAIEDANRTMKTVSRSRNTHWPFAKCHQPEDRDHGLVGVYGGVAPACLLISESSGYRGMVTRLSFPRSSSCQRQIPTAKGQSAAITRLDQPALGTRTRGITGVRNPVTRKRLSASIGLTTTHHCVIR